MVYITLNSSTIKDNSYFDGDINVYTCAALCALLQGQLQGLDEWETICDSQIKPAVNRALDVSQRACAPFNALVSAFSIVLM